MAGKITTGRQAPEYDNKRPNQILAVLPAQHVVVAYTNSEGRKSMALALIFGKDAEDGGPGIYILAEEQQMTEQLKIATTLVRKGVRSYLARQDEVEVVPDSLLEGPA